ncbi:MAG: hypothetical protein AB1486_00900 [Planctomycetota bacterium]
MTDWLICPGKEAPAVGRVVLMGKKKRYRGHYCWCCDRRRPNERFSGKGHMRHVCRDCSKLGKEELGRRQAYRDIDRCVNGPFGFRKVGALSPRLLCALRRTFPADS